MREIKFRGRDTDGNWHYGDLLRYVRDSYDMIIPVGHANSDDLYDDVVCVDYETVGQFTGLHDCEGQEIYEGDVLEYKTWAETGERYVTMGEVRYVQDRFLVVGPKDIVVQGLFSVAHEPALSDVLVVGNVYDNPEFVGGR